MAYQSFMGYLKSKLNHLCLTIIIAIQISNIALQSFVYLQLYVFKYSYLTQLICTQLYSVKLQIIILSKLL